MKTETNTKSNTEKTRSMTILAMFIAIILVMTFVPYLGYIQIPNFPSILLIHIPVLIGGVILGRKAAIILALVFGVGSLLKALYSPGLDYLFIFPWVSVLPRVLWGMMIYDVSRLFQKLISPRLLALSVSFVLLTVIHTLLVVPLLFSAFPLAFGVNIADNVGSANLDWINTVNSLSGFFAVLGGIFTTNGVIEAVLAGSVGAIVANRVMISREQVAESD
ncbi:MAG: ECF transporter S component [Bacilli bacterium]|nr:ECF transporter S component [Bacilli bacterium]MBN2696121.1 ECF transporter S component [Bacilli bacterium]